MLPCQLRGMFVFILKGLFCFNWKSQQSLKCEAAHSMPSKILTQYSLCLALQKVNIKCKKLKMSLEISSLWYWAPFVLVLMVKKQVFYKHMVQQKNKNIAFIRHCGHQSIAALQTAIPASFPHIRAWMPLARWSLCSNSWPCWALWAWHKRQKESCSSQCWPWLSVCDTHHSVVGSRGKRTPAHYSPYHNITTRNI